MRRASGKTTGGVIQERRKQELPAEMVADLMRSIRGQFYAESFTCTNAAKKWFQDARFLKVRVVLWPAGWLNKRGITLKPERYKAILLEVFQEIKSHGATAVVNYWPGYLAKCVQERFRHREEEIYAEGKALRNALESAMLFASKLSQAEPDPIEALNQARLVLTRQTPRHRQAPARSAGQMELFEA